MSLLNEYKCKIRIHLNENFILSDLIEISHVHLPEIAETEVKRTIGNLKEQKKVKKAELAVGTIICWGNYFLTGNKNIICITII